MEGASHGLDALIKISNEHWEKWSDNVGKKQVLDLANTKWNRINHINQSHGWVAWIQHAVQQVVPAVHDVWEQWNLLAVYELYTRTLLKVPDLVFMPGELERDKPEIRVKRLDQYRVAYMKPLSGKRQKVENPDAVGGSRGARGATQAGTAEIVDSRRTMPEKQVIGAGGNERAGATLPQDLAGTRDVPIDQNGTTDGMELLSMQEEPLGLNGDNLRRVRKRKRALKWVRRLSKMVETMAKKQCRGGAHGCARAGDLICHHGAG